ncbi:MAG: helix-turn-helix transcriptional regulator [Terriglobales bacterium]|jgi:transcriptional regulator with XRE-family HTH domain
MENARAYAYEMKRIYAARSKELCARLERARCEAGMTQEAVEIATGRSQSFLSRIKKGTQVIGVPELVQLAAIYRKPLRYFFDGWCTVGWSAADDDSRYSPEAARKWEREAKARRTRKPWRPKKRFPGQ